MNNSKDTKQRILDVAEELFAKDGYHNTSLRAITTKAEANLAAVNYHFGSKEALMTAVIERRLGPLNALRQKRLEEVSDLAKKERRRPRTEDVLLAFVEPTLLFKESSGGARNFITLVGRAITEPDDTVRSVFLRLIKPIFELLFNLLAEALPDLPRDILHTRLHFAVGAISHAMQMDARWPSPEDDITKAHSYDSRSLIDMLVPFISAGMEAKI